jgi:signal transduction histidine kinase
VQGQIRGSGLGLASSKQIVEQHGGLITVETQEGRGSIFTVRLPLAHVTDSPTGP